MSKVSEVSVRIPIEDAVAWDAWLTAELGVQAERFGLGYDGGEQYGSYEVFDFTGDPETVERAVVLALVSKGVRRPVTRKGKKVTVGAEPGSSPPWLVTYASHSTAYGKALHKVTREFSEREDLAAWFAGTGLTKVWFHEAHQPDRPAFFPEEQDEEGELYVMHFTDLTILDEEPSKAEAEQVARVHVEDMLKAVAEHVGQPLPV